MAGEGEVGDVAPADRVALFLQLSENLGVADGVPQDDAVGDVVEAQGLVGLLLGWRLRTWPSLAKKWKRCRARSSSPRCRASQPQGLPEATLVGDLPVGEAVWREGRVAPI